MLEISLIERRYGADAWGHRLGVQPVAWETPGTRLRVEPDFAYLLVQADLLCGSGACLACVVPTAGGGLTRTCVHGPVFDLTRLG